MEEIKSYKLRSLCVAATIYKSLTVLDVSSYYLGREFSNIPIGQYSDHQIKIRLWIIMGKMVFSSAKKTFSRQHASRTGLVISA